MKLFKKLSVFFLFIFSILVNSQNMQEGFTNLEKGEFNKAEVFFTIILKDYPTNKTARLCYARAVGLNNQPEKALQNFVDLKKEYPGDLEIELNYAEALLWNKKFDEAKIFYTELVAKNPTSFVAHLGFANTLSNLKEYKEALLNVNKALELSPANPGALVSRKYIKLGYANQKVNEKLYTEAETFYDEILIDFPNDKETLLNKANLYLITKDIAKGKEVYSQIAKDNPIIALNGLSLIEHIDGKDKQALETSNKSIEAIKDNTDPSLVKQTLERQVQALIWNKKYKLAETKINELNSQYKNENWLLALSATLAIYRSDYKECIKYYEAILVNDSKSFDGNLGIANAYYASGEIDKSIDAVFKTLEIFKNQNDAMNFLKKLNQEHTPFLEEKISFSYDNGNNTSAASRTFIQFPLSTKWAINTTYQFRKTGNKITAIKANSNDFLVGATYKINPKIIFNLEMGITAANSNTTSYTEPLFNSSFKIKPFKLNDLELGYKRDVQNFNTDLINQQISANNYYMNYNMGSNFNLGWFTQYYYTTQTDSNTRNLVFTSLYYNILSKPVLKTGLNYQYITFKDQVPTIYFSPKKFNAFEIFVDFLKDEKTTLNKSWFYNATGALGYQFIEDNEKQLTYRVQARFGYKFSDRLLANVYAGKSNIASVSVAGFTYTEFGIRLKWDLFKKPVFEIK
jgi:tetratricopeptide (TPR) repeat protein